MNDPILSPCLQRTPARNAPENPLSSIPYPLSPAVSARNALLLLCLLFLLTACGRRPGQPTPLPAGTRVAQNTPDFSAPAQAETTTQTADQVADSLRARLAQQRTPTAPTAAPPASADANPAPAPSALSAYPSLAVFSRPTALGILSAGGLLYSAPGAGAVTNLQLGATLTITGRSADGVWFAAYLADGIAGWVPAAQVRVFGDVNELEIVQESLGPAVVATLIAEASKPQAPVATVVARLTPALPPPLPPPLPSPRNNRPRRHRPRRRRQPARRTLAPTTPSSAASTKTNPPPSSAATRPATGSSSNFPPASAGSTPPSSKPPSPSPNSPSSTLPPPLPQNPRQPPDPTQHRPRANHSPSPLRARPWIKKVFSAVLRGPPRTSWPSADKKKLRCSPRSSAALRGQKEVKVFSVAPRGPSWTK